MPTVAEERIFLFRGKDGQGGPMTTHNEIVAFIQSIMPRKEKEARLKPVDFAEFVNSGINSQNAQVKEAMEAMLLSMRTQRSQNIELMAQLQR